MYRIGVVTIQSDYASCLGLTSMLTRCDLVTISFDFDSTAAVRRPFDCLSKVIKVTVT